MKKLNNVFIVFVLLVLAAAIGIANLGPESGYEVLGNPVNWLVAIAAFFLIVSFFAIYKAMETMRWMIQRKEGKLEESEEEDEEEKDDFLSNLWKKLQDSRPIEEEAEIELDHNYDGIRELDNNLPPWWLWGFYLSIVFAVIYLVRYHVTESAPLQIEEYNIEIAEAAKAKEEYLKTASNLVDESNVVYLTDPAKLKEGAAIYDASCAVCHLKDGGGDTGPNLADEYWLHGGSIQDVFSTIKYGVPSKGMISWKELIGPADMQKLASYVLSFQGTTPASPKEPQGDLYKPAGGETTVADSTAADADTTVATP